MTTTDTKIIRSIEGRAVTFRENNVNTDIIAPTKVALYVLTWLEAGDIFCYKRRYDDQGNPKPNIFDDEKHKGARILFTGENFGCGSSREHAAQGTKARYDAVIGISFAPIFAGNCYSIGLPLLTATPENMELLFRQVETNPQTIFKIDLEKLVVSFDGKEIPLILDEELKEGFLAGKWDERDMLAESLPKIKEVLARHPYIR